ncbi:MAG TPA: hypothetical protein VG672_01725 [Bryobacteraceae bacterium]|nr:hypothetical protein [Bryobacteraceae bacterium]
MGKSRTLAIIAGMLVWIHNPAAAQTVQWARQFASSNPNATYQIAADASGAYMVGMTRGALPGQTAANIQQDGFLRKYDPSGKELWTKEFDENSRPFSANSVAVDSSGVYVVGTTERTTGREVITENTLAVVSKYDTNGNLLWTQQSSKREGAVAVALGGGAVYVAGSDSSTGGQDVYLRKFDPSGNVQWSQKFGGTGFDVAWGVAADASGAYIVGNSGAGLSGEPTGQLFIRKYDPSGNVLWTQTFGTLGITEYAHGVSVSSSGVYVIGSTEELIGVQTLPTFDLDAYVRKYDTNGNLQWTQQFGTIDREDAFNALADANGVYVVGYTRSVVGAASLGGEDAYLRRFDSNGNTLWTIQTGSVDDDYGYGVATDGSGIYIGGYTDRNSIPGTLTNSADSFLYKYSPPASGGPVVPAGAIVNNASFAPNPAPVAPGSIAAIFGTGLNNGMQVLTSSFGVDHKLVTSLGGASVTVGGIAAPMFYSTSGQLGVQIPIELAGQASADVQVTAGGQSSQVRSVPLKSVAPGLFTVSQDGRGTATCLHSDGVTAVSASKPAHPGEEIVLYGTGFGAVTPALATGQPSSGNKTVATPTVTIDGLPAQVVFSGAAPGFVGLYQVNVVVPELARTNSADPIALTLSGVAANAVTLPVAPGP